MDLAGRVALVTGASRGVGAATAVALADAGCAVACAARSTARAPQSTPGTIDATVARITAAGGTAVAVPTDLSDPLQVEAMIAATVDRFGRLDVLVNNAAVTFPGDLDLPLKRYELTMAINLTAPLLAIRAARPHLAARGGAIVNVSSAAAFTAYPGLMAYGMSKVALERLTVDAATQLADDGVAVTCFRIDVPVASEGFLRNAPDEGHDDWEPPAVAAEGILWTLRRAHALSGRRLSMRRLRDEHGIMAPRAPHPFSGAVAAEHLPGGHRPG